MISKPHLTIGLDELNVFGQLGRLVQHQRLAHRSSVCLFTVISSHLIHMQLSLISRALQANAKCAGVMPWPFADDVNVES